MGTDFTCEQSTLIKRKTEWIIISIRYHQFLNQIHKALLRTQKLMWINTHLPLRCSLFSALSRLSCVLLCATLCTVSRQAFLSMRFSRQEYWSGLLLPTLGDLPDPGFEPESCVSCHLHWQADSLPLAPPCRVQTKTSLGGKRSEHQTCVNRIYFHQKYAGLPIETGGG